MIYPIRQNDLVLSPRNGRAEQHKGCRALKDLPGNCFQQVSGQPGHFSQIIGNLHEIRPELAHEWKAFPLGILDLTAQQYVIAITAVFVRRPEPQSKETGADDRTRVILQKLADLLGFAPVVGKRVQQQPRRFDCACTYDDHVRFNLDDPLGAFVDRHDTGDREPLPIATVEGGKFEGSGMFEQPKVRQRSYLRQEMRGEFIDAAGTAPLPAISAAHALSRGIRAQVDGFPGLKKEKIRAERAGVAVDENSVNLSGAAGREKGSVRELTQTVAFADPQCEPFDLTIVIGKIAQRNRHPAVLTIG